MDTHTVVSADGTRLAVQEHGEQAASRPTRPTVVLVHGYPDRHDVWDQVVEALPADDFHVVSYDVRGAGSSDVPASAAGYRTDRLVEDLLAVVEAVRPDGAAVHLVGHDWGSVQLWEAVLAAESDPRLAGRVASFVSVSGPALDHVTDVLTHPRGRARRVLRQVLASWYVYAFHVPLLPEWLWRRWHGPLGRAVARREGLPTGHWGPGLGADAAHGLQLYRANLWPRLRGTRAAGQRRTAVPVLVVHPERDAFLTDVLLEGLELRCSDLRIERLRAGHWVVATQPDRIAALVREHVLTHA